MIRKIEGPLIGAAFTEKLPKPTSQQTEMRPEENTATTSIAELDFDDYREWLAGQKRLKEIAQKRRDIRLAQEMRDKRGFPTTEEAEAPIPLVEGKKGTMRDDREEFKSFMKSNAAFIIQEYKDGRGTPLEDIIYRYFYSIGEETQSDSGALESLVRTYDQSVKDLEEDIPIHQKDGLMQHIEIVADEKLKRWSYYRINGGVEHSESIGRLYLNVKPEAVVEMCAQLTAMANNEGVALELKIPRYGSVEAFNRRDKMVVYFNESQARSLVELIDGLVLENQNSFNEDVPRFTTPLADNSGKAFPGIAFAEEPRTRGESFGTRISKVLAWVVADASQKGLSVADERFDFNSSFSRRCKEFGVNASNPAFNDGETGFEDLKKRIMKSVSDEEVE